MTQNELKLKLGALEALRSAKKPDQVWVAQNRAALLSRVEANAPVVLPRVGVRKIFFVLRPVMAVMLMAGFGAAGWVASISSALGTLPGDPLYVLKTAGERAQLTFATDSEAKAYLHLEFVSRRLDEVAALAESNDPDRVGGTDRAVAELKNEIAMISGNLDDVRAHGSAANLSSVAVAVDRKVAEVHAVLRKTKNLLAPETMKRVNEVESLADDVSIKAIAVLVETAKQGAGPSDVASRVQESINSAEQKILVASEEGNVQATAALKQAKEALSQDNLAEAVSKVKESNDLVNDAQVKVQVTPVNANTNTNTNATSNANTKTKVVE